LELIGAPLRISPKLNFFAKSKVTGYGLGNHNLWLLKSDRTLDSPIDCDNEEFSWPTSLAGSPDSDKVFVATMGGIGWIFSYDQTSGWKRCFSLRYRDPAAIALAPSGKSLFGVCLARNKRRLELVEFSLSGAIESTRQYDAPRPVLDRLRNGQPTGHTQLAIRGETAYLISAPPVSKRVESPECLVLSIPLSDTKLQIRKLSFSPAEESTP